MIEFSLKKEKGSTKLTNSFLRLNLSDYIEEFFVGITHDKNMRRMAEYFETHKPNLSENNPDFYETFNLKHSISIRETFETYKIRQDELEFPIFSNYKMTSLD